MENDKIIIYQTEDGQTQIDVRLENETVWLTQAQMAELFETDRTSIVRHINNIYKVEELDRESTCAKIAQVQIEGKRTVKRNIPYFNLDMIISVGYRVNSKRGVKFRQWANKVLKQYLIKGYAVNDRIRKEQIGELRQLVGMLGRTIQNQSLLSNDETNALFEVVTNYTYALDTLDNYDYERLTIDKTTKEEPFHATYENAMEAINGLREKFGGSALFGNEKDDSFKSSIGQIYQTFGGEELYPSVEEKAAMLLYLVTKNHSFSDGNKRIAATLFLWFLNYLNKNLTSDITIKYKFKNIPKTISEESTHSGELSVTASGQGYNLFQESFKTRNIPLNIDLDTKAQDNRPLLKYASNKGKAYIITSDLRPLIRKKVGEKINLSDIKPDTIFFDIINVKEKKVPVDISNIEYKLIDGQRITKTMIIPDSVSIIGKTSSIDSIVSIGVEDKNLGLLKAKKQYNLVLDIPDGISASQSIVSISHEIGMFTRASKRIKIKPVNFPPEYSYTVLPQYVDVNYLVQLSHFNDVQEYNFTATADYRNAKGNIIEIKVQSNDGKVQILRSSSETCCFILEKK